jgi:hypothetical protein
MTTETALHRVQAHLDDHVLSRDRPALLIYLRQLLTQADRTSVKADALQQWLNELIFTAALDPDNIEAALTGPPHSFAEVVQEVVASLRETPSVPSV